ncbi:hypothetical protein PPL_04316 [Heterostelium album PN500]|uniref:Uncharacterized protein n=1 Tax=Heterostelium pallidum (strain ATCC 26659 / Pp 5 / PN500) TaxID=670386 RepID=D3B781_HETP5|nr:hypothetical protein PPL_04316 [Heterostelium album PN500]EFA82624.1 hypothetical protein PPL_04316 [Heterostelium album PN500]|eukprot:XP_020434741.1 hypothetical protein PPL_04316 [Heterostelium album PN500]
MDFISHSRIQKILSFLPKLRGLQQNLTHKVILTTHMILLCDPLHKSTAIELTMAKDKKCKNILIDYELLMYIVTRERITYMMSKVLDSTLKLAFLYGNTEYIEAIRNSKHDITEKTWQKGFLHAIKSRDIGCIRYLLEEIKRSSRCDQASPSMSLCRKKDSTDIGYSIITNPIGFSIWRMQSMQLEIRSCSSCPPSTRVHSSTIVISKSSTNQSRAQYETE